MSPRRAYGPADWRAQLAGAARSVEDLVSRGVVDASDAQALESVAGRYRVLVTDYYLSLIDPDDPHDPIRRQAIPHADELVVGPLERRDPIADAPHAPTELLVHRHPDRVLLFPTFRCPMYCRYCFRKVALNERDIRLRGALEASIDYLRDHPDVREVILSGGDPLLLPDERLAWLLEELSSVPSIRRIRVHTRVPVTLPMRVDAALAARLRGHRPLSLVAHFNHPRELTPEADAAIDALAGAGIPVFNQSVLLRGVNDDVDTLAALCEGLLERGVRPYYLHHPDLTVGTGHLRVSLDDGLRIHGALRRRVAGLALPQYVLDVPGGLGKVPVDSSFVVRTGRAGVWRLSGPLGGPIEYVDPAVHPRALRVLPGERAAGTGAC